MGRIKDLWDQGNVAVVNGIGYPKPDRSHFRSMDIWHTAETGKVDRRRMARQGDQGNSIRRSRTYARGSVSEQECPGRCIYPGLRRCPVSQLEGYGLLTTLSGEKQRRALNAFTRMYMPEEFEEQNMMLEHIGQTGIDAMTGADLLKGGAPRLPVERGVRARSLVTKSSGESHRFTWAGLGTRVFYTQIGGFRRARQ